MITMRKFKAEDLAEVSKQMPNAFGGGLDTAKFGAVYEKGTAYTVRNEAGVIIGCGGVVEHWKGVGEIWMYPTKAILARKNELVAICKAFLAEIKKEGYWRGEALVNTKHVEHYRFAKAFLFKVEGKQRKKAPDGSDCYMMARIF